MKVVDAATHFIIGHSLFDIPCSTFPVRHSLFDIQPVNYLKLLGLVPRCPLRGDESGFQSEGAIS